MNSTNANQRIGLISKIVIVWLSVFLILISISVLFKKPKLKFQAVALYVGVITHLFLDWFSGRTAGIQIFHPFSNKIYSLFTLNPEKGKILVFPNRQQLAYLRFYTENKFLTFIELGIMFTALVMWIKASKRKSNI